jgi:predicted alpha/beta-fold hydrolase
MVAFLSVYAAKWRALFICAFLALAQGYKTVSAKRQHVVKCAPTPSNEEILQRVEGLLVPPVPWLGGMPGVFETLVYNLFLADTDKTKEPLTFTRQEISLADGGLISLDWCDSMSPSKHKAPILLTLPGWGTTNRTGYVKDWVHLCTARGYRVAVLNCRGSAGMPLTSEHLPNLTEITDTKRAIDLVHTNHPEAPLFAVGFSIGANMLASYLGKVGSDTPVVAACSISNPYDLDSLHLLETRFPLNITFVRQAYEKIFLDGLKKSFTKYRKAMKMNKLWDFDTAMGIHTMDEMSAYVSLHMFGFSSQKEYLDHGSCKDLIQEVQVPFLCLSARNDPLVPPECIAFLNDGELYTRNPKLVAVISAYGGHFSFLKGLWSREPWSTAAAADFMDFFLQ